MGASGSVNVDEKKLTSTTITNMTTEFVNNIKTTVGINIITNTNAKQTSTINISGSTLNGVGIGQNAIMVSLSNLESVLNQASSSISSMQNNQAATQAATSELKAAAESGFLSAAVSTNVSKVDQDTILRSNSFQSTVNNLVNEFKTNIENNTTFDQDMMLNIKDSQLTNVDILQELSNTITASSRNAVTAAVATTAAASATQSAATTASTKMTAESKAEGLSIGALLFMALLPLLLIGGGGFLFVKYGKQIVGKVFPVARYVTDEPFRNKVNKIGIAIASAIAIVIILLIVFV